MAEGNWNPLSSFQEMGTLSKVLLLLGFVFLGTVLTRGASFSDPMLPASLAFIFLSLAVHYLSECRQTVDYDDESTTVTDWGKIAIGTVMSLITAGLIVWALWVPNKKVTITPTTASKDVSKPSDVPNTPAVEKDATTPVTEMPTKKSKGAAAKRSTGDGPQALGDKSAAVGSVTQGPCSSLQVGGEHNESTVNCHQPTIQSLMLVAKLTCSLRTDVERPLLSDRDFAMMDVKAALLQSEQPKLWLNVQSPIHQEETNGKLELTERYLASQESGWIGKSVDSIPAIDKVMAGVLSITFYDCTENTYSARSMAVYINGTEVWSSANVSTGKDSVGTTVFSASANSWPTRDQLSKKLLR